MLFPQSKTLILVTTLLVVCGRNRMLLGKVAESGPCLEYTSLSLCALGTFENLHTQEQAFFVVQKCVAAYVIHK